MAEVFETSDIELAEDLLSARYADVRIDARGSRRGMRLAQTSLGLARLDQVGFGMSFDAAVTPRGTLVVAELTSGRIEHYVHGAHRGWRPGDVYLTGYPEHPFSATIEDAELDLTVLDPALLSQVADGAPERNGQPIRFSGHQPVSEQAAASWKATCAYLRDTVVTRPAAADQPLIAASAARLLAATALAVFPNNAIHDPTCEDRHDAHSATLRRAVAFIDENACQDIGVADVAAAAHVTIRAIQLAFRRHLETTPMEYLRGVRLGRAHHDLITADPGHDSVTAIAYRWGFPSPSRFAAYYRQAYGVPPSRTLRT